MAVVRNKIPNTGNKKRARKFFIPDANYLRRLHVACAHVRFTDKNLKADGFGRLLSAFRNADRINVIGRAASNVLKLSYHFWMF